MTMKIPSKTENRTFGQKSAVPIVATLWIVVVLLSSFIAIGEETATNSAVHTVTFENSSWYVFGGQWILHIYKIEGGVIHLASSYTTNSSGIINVTLKGNLSSYAFISEYSVTMTANLTFNAFAYGVVGSSYVSLDYNRTSYQASEVIINGINNIQ